MAKIAAHAGADVRANDDRGICPAMARVAAALIDRWQSLSDGGVVEVKAETSRVALEALVGCIFSDGLGDPKAVRDATIQYYATCGGLDPFDVLGLPDFVPRFTRLGVQHVLRGFYEALSTAITERRHSLAAEPNAPRDMLGAMLAAKDPQTGQPMTEAEVKDKRHDLHLRRADDIECVDLGDLFAVAISPMGRAGCRGSRRSDRQPCARCGRRPGTPIAERPPHRTVRAQFRHTACMGLSLSREHHAIFVVLCHSILLFDPRREHSSVPTAYSIAVARSGGQGRCFFNEPKACP
jgi:hypothetical protein